MLNQRRNLMKNLGIVFLSIIMAVVLAKTGALESLLVSTQETRIIGSLLAGIFFVSIFTVAPASVMLVEIARVNPIWEVALFGGIGALIGDFIIFRFIKDSLSQDILKIANRVKLKKLRAVLHSKLLRWLMPVMGAIIVASPLPDEIGLAMMGLSKMKTRTFVITSFLLNFLGIFVIAWLAKRI